MVWLTGDWWLAPDPSNVGRAQRWFDSGPVAGAQPASVPGSIQQTFADYHGVAWYWHRFVPQEPAGPLARYQLHFQGAVDYLGEAWLNGQLLGGYEGGEGPFDLDATAALQPGQENLLVVRVLNPTHAPIDGYTLRQVPHRNKAMPFSCGSSFNYGGIMLPVELRVAPVVRSLDLWARPNLHDGSVLVRVTVRNDATATVSGRLSVAIGAALPTTGPTLESTSESMLTLQPGTQTVEARLRVAQPHLWNLDDPYLYQVRTRLNAAPHGASIEDEQVVRCGFREFRVDRGYFRLNGRRVFARSTHTGNHFPYSWAAPIQPDLVRRDLINAKASGFNMVRFISGVALPEQLDFCDELGLMVYEECLAAWCLEDSPHMAERFERNTSAMILRDRNHPCVTVWGLLNETNDGPVFRCAHSLLPQVRQLDDTRLVLLASGRWDRQWNIGSVSNPGSDRWEHVWGGEAADADAAPATWPVGGYRPQAGDAHVYPRVPQTPETNRLLRTLGQGTRPVLLSEYGIGSLLNVIREVRRYEQDGARPDLFDVSQMRSMGDRLEADWQRLGLDGVYPFAEDMLRDSQRLHARQRLLGFDLIRANPQFCGFNLTGMLDHALTGEGLWSFTREWKPGIVDALCDGWAPVRWCLFVEPSHGYRGRPFHVEAVLANEDVLPPGVYPVTFRICGPEGVAWEKRVDLRLPEAAAGGDTPLAVPALDEMVELAGPAGTYELAAYMQHGGAPAGGRLRFHLSDAAGLPRLEAQVEAWGLAAQASAWLAAHGVTTRPLASAADAAPGVILVGQPAAGESDLAHWLALLQRIARGSVALLLSPQALARDANPVGWLPLANKGRCYEFNDWLYHKECVAKRHSVFAGLPGPGIMDWEYYGPVIPSYILDGQDTPDEVIAAAFATGNPACPGGYGSGVLVGAYRVGRGQFAISTLRILEHLDRHPAADRLLLNMVDDAGRRVARSASPLPDDWDQTLAGIGYR